MADAVVASVPGFRWWWCLGHLQRCAKKVWMKNSRANICRVGDTEGGGEGGEEVTHNRQIPVRRAMPAMLTKNSLTAQI